MRVRSINVLVWLPISATQDEQVTRAVNQNIGEGYMKSPSPIYPFYLLLNTFFTFTFPSIMSCTRYTSLSTDGNW